MTSHSAQTRNVMLNKRLTRKNYAEVQSVLESHGFTVKTIGNPVYALQMSRGESGIVYRLNWTAQDGWVPWYVGPTCLNLDELHMSALKARYHATVRKQARVEYDQFKQPSINQADQWSIYRGVLAAFYNHMDIEDD